MANMASPPSVAPTIIPVLFVVFGVGSTRSSPNEVVCGREEVPVLMLLSSAVIVNEVVVAILVHVIFHVLYWHTLRRRLLVNFHTSIDSPTVDLCDI